MKRIFYTFICIVFLASSCGQSAEEKAAEEKQRIQDSIQLEKDRDSLLNSAIQMIDTSAVKIDSTKKK